MKLLSHESSSPCVLTEQQEASGVCPPPWLLVCWRDFWVASLCLSCPHWNNHEKTVTKYTINFWPVVSDKPSAENAAWLLHILYFLCATCQAQRWLIRGCVCVFSANGNGPLALPNQTNGCVFRGQDWSVGVYWRENRIKDMRGCCSFNTHPPVCLSVHQSVSVLSALLSVFFFFLVPGLLHHAGSSSAPDLAGSLVGSANSARR